MRLPHISFHTHQLAQSSIKSDTHNQAHRWADPSNDDNQRWHAEYKPSTVIRHSFSTSPYEVQGMLLQHGWHVWLPGRPWVHRRHATHGEEAAI